MAYVNVAAWKPDQVTDWLKGLDSVIAPYIQSFLNNNVTGQQLLSFRPDDLEHLGIYKIGHQEIILEGVEHLRNIHYELDRENLQYLAMKLSCLAHSLHNELIHSHTDTQRLSTQILADIANIVTAVKPLIAWLDRPGFSGELEYKVTRSEILSLAFRMATCGLRDRFAVTPVSDMVDASAKLAKLADSIIQDMTDPLILQPASLDLATIKKRSSDDLGFYILPSFRGVHQISDLKLNSAAHQSGKIEPGDEIIQINYQTVVGWDVKHVMTLFAESPTEVYLTLKKRPRHTKVYGQIYVKPYRLPSKKRAMHVHPFARRPEFHLPFRLSFQKVTVADTKKTDNPRDSRCSEGNSSDEEVTVRHNLVVPNKPVHRRATITGASPLSKRPPLDIHELWDDLKLEKDSSLKQSSTSVVDFEERVSSANGKLGQVPPALADTSKKEDSEPVKTELLSIKQRIELFSQQGDKQEKPKVPLRPHVKPQIRINSEPIFDNNAIVEADHIVKKDHSNVHPFGGPEKQHKPNVKKPDPETQINTSCTSVPTIEEKEPVLKTVPVETKSESTSNEPPAYEMPPPAVLEEHGRVVETINRHLLFDKLNYDDTACENEAMRIGKMLESLSNSLPHSARFRKGIVIGESHGPLSTHSLPVRKPQNNNNTGREFDSSLSRTISRVYREDNFYRKEDPPSPEWKLSPAPAMTGFQFQEIGARMPRVQEDFLEVSDRKEPEPGVFPLKSDNSAPLKSQFKDERFPENPKRINEQVELGFPRHLDNGTANIPQERQTLPKAAPRYNPGEHLRQSSGDAATLHQMTVVSPPVPPPRPSLSKPPGACYRAIMAARSIGRGSPKTQRKKNNALPKGRNVAVKDFSEVDCQGWLLQRCRKGSGTWKKRWCLVHSNTLYTFQNKQGTKAETMVYLPGFTVSPADEVKSKPFAFKVYHTGTTFYFAAETQFELSVWLDGITTATLAQNSQSQGITFSESENEDPKDDNTQRRVKNSVVPPAPVPRPAVVQPNQPSESHKKFGSLKKLGCRTIGSNANSGSNNSNNNNNNNSSNSGSSTSSSGNTGSGSSLDRKYLRLLGTGPVPVPTAQYRSYRRVHNTPSSAIVPPPHSVGANMPNLNNACSVGGHNSGEHHHHHQQLQQQQQQVLPPEMADYRLASLTAKTTPPVPRRRILGGGNQNHQNQVRPHISPPILNHPPLNDDRSTDNRFRRQPPAVHPINREYRDGSAEMMWVGSLRRPDTSKKKSKKTSNITSPSPLPQHLSQGTSSSIHLMQSRGSQLSYQESESLISSPDYPGLEYPPVFEPGTYTLDTTAVLPRLNRHRPS